ncbi:MAG: hypothetical protein EP329_03815 [Deltaproteobacteria bacterium]|nr:MAG: hypothetical protein EP329_03815 [Deltaproteobacteria bacterium]
MLTVTLFVLMTALAASTTSVEYGAPVIPDGSHAFAIARRGDDRWLVRYDLAEQRVALWAPLPVRSHLFVVSADGRRAVTCDDEDAGVIWEIGAQAATRRGAITLWDPSVPKDDVLGHLTPTQLIARGERLVAKNTDGGTAWVATLGASAARWSRLPDDLVTVSEDGARCLVHGPPPSVGPCGVDAPRKALPLQEGAQIRTSYGADADPRFAGDLLLYDVSLVDAGVEELTAWSVPDRRPLWTSSSWHVPELFPQPDGSLWVVSTRTDVEGSRAALHELDPKNAAVRRSLEVGELDLSAVAVVDGVLYATPEFHLFPIYRWDLAKGERLPDLTAPGPGPSSR